MVRHPISQTSGVKIWPLARMERGFVSKSCAGDAEFVFFGWNLSEYLVGFYDSERFGECL